MNPVIDEDGDKWWYQNGKCHRDDGPAVEWVDGDKWWYQNDLLDRHDGPAIEKANGQNFWYIDGLEYSFDQWCDQANVSDSEKLYLELKYR